MNSSSANKRRLILVCLTSAVVLVGLASWMRKRAIYRFLAQDRIWASKVRKQFNPEETRAWALKSIRLADYGMAGAEARFLLTNAPAYLLKMNYKRNPEVLVGHKCIHLLYGGGLYHWGLTIGGTNLPASSARGRQAETWAEGIYFWNN